MSSTAPPVDSAAGAIPADPAESGSSVHTPVEDQLRQFLEYAVLAPSVLNTQPWRFVVRDHKVLLYADRSRQLHALDPLGRELTISCGAALFHLHAAARQFRFDSESHSFPDPAAPDLLATFALTNPRRPTPEDEALFRAISIRRTNRHPFANTPLGADVIALLERAARQQSARLAVLASDFERDAVGALVEEGVLLNGQRSDVTEEIRKWLRPNQDPRRDGVPDREQGSWDGRSDVRTPSAVLAPRKRELIRESPAVFVLATDTDDPAAWLDAGQALAQVLLVAAGRGLSASYINQPVEFDSLRKQLSLLIGGGFPQLVFRVGYPSFREGTPRRSVRDVLTD